LARAYRLALPWLAETVWLASLRRAARAVLLADPGRPARQGVLPSVWRLAVSVAAGRMLLLLALIGLVGEEQPRQRRR